MTARLVERFWALAASALTSCALLCVWGPQPLMAQETCKTTYDCATAAVTAAGNAVGAFKALDQKVNGIALVAVPAEKRDAARNPADPNFTATGSCPAGSAIVGYYCQIDAGGGNLQNAGINTVENQFTCTWNGIGGPFRAWGRAACLRLKKD